MSQTAYSLTIGKAFAGMKADSTFDLVESAVAYNEIAFGRGLQSYGTETDVTIARRDVATVTYGADFGSSNVIALTINGTAIASVEYASAHAATATALLAAINAVSGVVATKDTAGRVYTIRTKGAVATVTGAVTGGSAVTTTVEAITASAANMKFRGVSVHRHTEGNGVFLAKEVADVIRRGRVWVDTKVAVNANEAAYVDLADGLGKFTNVSTNNLATGGVFKTAVGAAGLAVVEINLP